VQPEVTHQLSGAVEPGDVADRRKYSGGDAGANDEDCDGLGQGCVSLDVVELSVNGAEFL
jgi:hypothetical protein